MGGYNSNKKGPGIFSLNSFFFLRRSSRLTASLYIHPIHICRTSIRTGAYWGANPTAYRVATWGDIQFEFL